MRPLTYILLFVFLTCVFTLVGAATLKGQTIELTPEEAATCEAEGGCMILTRKSATQLLELINHLEKQAKEAKGKSCA